jgi:type II secretory ATPase GspE/PulE/Tfp pilus assembly ATPase PilB-like protein
MHSSLPQQITNFGYGNARWLTRVFGWLERLMIRKSRVVIVICEELEMTVRAIDPNVPTVLIENAPGSGEAPTEGTGQMVRASLGLSEDAPVIKIVNLILAQAIKEKASDIHIEPFNRTLKLRYRVDGDLVAAESPPKALQLAITSRIKILAGLNIAERRVPQDGRFRIKVMGREVDLRISILPTSHGEKVVIRILDKSTLAGSIDSMGLDEETIARFRKAIDAPHGMILVTGPTGSGKTTTLYSVLQELNSPNYNIVTVEDPIEYELMGVNQVAVRPDIGLDFASALRSILRQDPDIVMVGEIRDNETADIAVKAALTGHQVLSTLHTNDAAGAISRLDDMGIEPFLIANSVIMTCAQRLLRRVCFNCREEFVPEPEMFQRLGMEPVEGAVFYHGIGCDRCKGRGYSGRAAIIEALPVSEAIRRLIIKRASAAVITKPAPLVKRGEVQSRLARRVTTPMRWPAFRGGP